MATASEYKMMNLFKDRPAVLSAIEISTHDIERIKFELWEYTERGDRLLASYARNELVDRLEAIENYLITGAL